MPRIIALQACRHGTGCSHLAANLAVLLMQAGHRVGLLDTDPRGGGIRTLFAVDAPEPADLSTYWWFQMPAASAPAPLDKQLYRYRGDRPTTPSGIYLPPAGGQLGLQSDQATVLKAYYDSSNVGDMVHHLSRDLHLSYIILDIQPEMTDDALMGLALADTTLLLMQLDTYDFQRAAVVIEVMQKLGTRKIWLVPSQVLPVLTAEAVQEKLETTYNRPVAGVLPLSEEMVRLASQGIFCLQHPDHVLSDAMRAIATQTILDTPTATRAASSSNGKWFQSRQRSLFALLEFPTLERHILTTVLRQGSVTLAELMQHHDEPADAIAAAIQQLLQQGWLTRDPDSDGLRFRDANASANPSPQRESPGD